MTRLDRRALFASGAAAALLAATGLSAAPIRGGHLRAALSGATFGDRWDSAEAGLFMQAARLSVFETLTEIAPDGTLRGGLATAWSVENDGLDWTFDIREGVSFHDSRPLKMEDIVQSLVGLGDIQAQGDRWLHIHLDQQDMALPFKLSDARHAIQPSNPERAAAGIGSGLYRAIDFEPGRRFSAERVQTHWKDGSAGWFDRIEFAHVSEVDVRLDALARGLVDVADVPNGEDLGADFRRMPNPRDTWQIANSAVAIPAVVGTAAPLDNLRFAERWWRA